MSQKDIITPYYRLLIERGRKEIEDWQKSPIDYNSALNQMQRTLRIGIQMEASHG